MNICIIDDSSDITELLKEYLLLSDIHCSITTFNNPQRAIAYIQRRQDIDVLITDMHMGAFS
ncbi:MAG: response regulator, partial [Fibrobacterota bacterium]